MSMPALLNVAYAEVGPANGPVVILLHGWPYDIYSFVDVAPLLARQGYRVIDALPARATATRISSPTTPCATASRRRWPTDVIALMDALKISRPCSAAFDWGARSADIVAGAVAGARQGAGLGQRLPDRQPGRRQARRCRPRPSCNGGTSSTSPPERGRAGYEKHRTTSPS